MLLDLSDLSRKIIIVPTIISERAAYTLVKWLTLENEKKTAVSQDWRHKKDIEVLV